MDIEPLGDRARDFALASTLTSYPDDEVAETLRTLAPSLATHAGAGVMLSTLSREHGLDDLRSRYIELFDRGDGRVSLYETEYGRMRGMAKGNDLADISGFYRAFGLQIDEQDAHEMLDHLAVELEFYAVLLAKQEYLARVGDAEGIAIVEDAQKKFLEAHLGPLARGVTTRFAAAADRGEYGEVLAWCGELVNRECVTLGVAPTPLDFFADEEGKAEMKCGAVRLPVVS